MGRSAWCSYISILMHSAAAGLRVLGVPTRMSAIGITRCRRAANGRSTLVRWHSDSTWSTWSAPRSRVEITISTWRGRFILSSATGKPEPASTNFWSASGPRSCSKAYDATGGSYDLIMQLRRCAPPAVTARVHRTQSNLHRQHSGTYAAVLPCVGTRIYRCCVPVDGV